MMDLTAGREQPPVKAGRLGAWIVSLLCFLCLLSLPLPAVVAAQPTGFQEYYVLGYEEHIWRAFLGIYDGPDRQIPGRICSSVSLVATADHQVIYYDHWEDGYEANLLEPVQTTTEVHGDRDPSNGGEGSDVLLAGDTVNLNSDQDLVGPEEIHGYVPVAPARNPIDIRYDGGDRIISSGGPVGLTHATWPIGKSWIGGAWEVYSRQAYAKALSYRLPIGEDLYGFGGGDNGAYGDFRNVYLQLSAFEDNTIVTVENGTEAVNLALDRGATYSSMGYIGSSPAPAITIKSGTIVRSNKPTQVGLVTGADSVEEEGFQGRFLNIQSDPLWGADYVVPVPSGNVGNEAEVYLTNPNDFPITVNAYDAEIQTTFVISPSGHQSATVPYSAKRGGLGYVPSDSAVRFTSSEGIFGVFVTAGTSETKFDWGFSPIPARYLGQDYYVSWAPGTFDLSDNGSPLWVTPLADNTAFYVDYSPLDGIVDEAFSLDALEQRRVFDPDNDNTGTHIWATGEFAMAWGEDPRTAGLSSPYFDLGVASMPQSQPWLDPVLTLHKTSNPTTLPSAGGTVTFTLVAQSHNSPFNNVDISDTLPVNWVYVPGSTRVTFPDGSSVGPDPTRDGRTLVWDLSTNLDINQSLTLAFQAQITNTGGVDATAFDGFESATYSGGANWVSDWQEQDDDGDPAGGDVRVVTTDAPFAGNHHLQMRSAGKSIARTVDLGEFVLPVLRFARRVDRFESGDYVYLDIYDGLSWTTVMIWGDGDLEGLYVNEVVELTPYASTATAIRFRTGEANGSGDCFYVDQIEVYEGLRVSINHGQAIGRDRYSGALFSPSDDATVYISPFSLTKSVNATKAGISDTLVYTLSYAHFGGSAAPNVILRDVVPIQFVTFQSASDGGVYDGASGSVLWTLGTLSPGASGVVTFSVSVNSFVEDGTVVENVAYLESDLTRVASNEVRTTVFAPNVAFTKSGPNNAVPGEVITYTLVYQNIGGDEATGALIWDHVPPSTSYVPDSLAINTGSGWVPLSDAADGDQGAFISPTIVITPGVSAGTIAPGESGQVRFNVQISEDLPPPGLILNSAVLERDFDIPRESNTVATFISTLQLLKEAEQETVAPSGVISYTLAYRNVSIFAPQTDVYVIEPVPSFTRFLPGTASGGDIIEYSWDHGASWSATVPITPVTHLRWYDASLPPSAEETVGFAVQVDAKLPANTAIRNVARITSVEVAGHWPGWIPSNEVRVGTVDLWVEKRVSQSSASAGETISYTVYYGNHGTAHALGVLIEDTLPVGTTYVPGSIWGKGADDSNSPNLIWSVGTVKAGVSAKAVGYAAVLSSNLQPGAVITNTATLRSAYGVVTSDPVTTTIVTVTELSLLKWAFRDEVFAGSQLGYGILVGNRGARANNLVVSDTLPAHTTFAECDCAIAGLGSGPGPATEGSGFCGAPFTCGMEGDTLVWRVDEIAAGRSLQMTFWVTVDAGLSDGALVINEYYAAAADHVPPVIGSPPVTTTVRELALSISKVAWPDPVALGQELILTITLQNEGSVLRDLTVTDVLPSGVSFVSCKGALCELFEDGRPQVIWWLPNLSTSQERRLTMRVLPDRVKEDTLVNESYSVWVPAAGRRVWGAPVEVAVIRTLKYQFFLPLVLKNVTP